jgi:alpha-ketoglutarate-dependent taurine dioxygenase
VLQSITLSAPERPIRLPLAVHCRGSVELSDLVAERPELIAEWLLEHGAVLFRGFAANSVERFEKFAAALALRRSEYLYRSTPRTAVGDRIFTATEYPADREIPLHNENAYQRTWPLKVGFCCVTPSHSGGATPLADMRRVTQAVGAELVARFGERRIRYVRHYQPYVDLSWQTVFQTQDREAIAQYCSGEGIHHEWLDDETLRTWQICQGTAQHPLTGETLLFNQAHLFHVSSLEPEDFQLLSSTVGPDRLPRNAYYGNGDAIDVRDLDTVRQCLRAHSVPHQWQSGDVLLLDNMRVAHGRQPFKGPRRLLAVLLDQHTAGPV